MTKGAARIGRRRRGLSTATAALACGSLACATRQAAPLQRDLAAMRADLESERENDARLEVRLARVESRLSALEAARTLAPPPNRLAALPVVKLEPPTTPQAAPPLDTSIDLKEPDAAALAALDGPALAVAERPVDAGLPADGELSLALQRYDAGDRREAGRELAAFAARHPHDPQAAHARYLAGMALALDGRCQAGEGDFAAVARDYPEDGAAGESLVAVGECEAGMGHLAAARRAFWRVVHEYDHSPAASRAARELSHLGKTGGPVAGRP